MNTKTLAITIVFAAVTVALNPAISGIAVPAPYAPFLFYQIWEIPIVAAFVLISRKSGIAIAVLNALILFALFPGFLPSGPFYNLFAGLSTLAGIFIANIVLTRGAAKDKKPNSNLQFKAKMITLSTALGIILRVGIMSLVNYAVLRYPYPIGYQLPEIVIIGYLPLIGLFNATLALYTVPLGYSIAKIINRNLKLNSNV
jgi:riboflavin transporter FmnP